ncbi:MAG TPA: hypothetical protein VFQ40_07185, partial [Actinomycetota bacterium]|nr:hypothetical protein [Actinomycetota bacterium]
QERGRQAIERIREAQDRITALEEMLAAARDREHELTTQVVRGRTRILELEAEVSELDAIAARVVTAEEEQERAAALASERERESVLARAEVEAQGAEIGRLRARTAELEADLRSVSQELAGAAIARTQVARLQLERDEAIARAQTERRLAGEDRVRAAEANLRATELQRQLREAERRIVRATNGNAEQAKQAAEAAGAGVSAPPPWIELQRTSSRSAPEAVEDVEEPAVPGADGGGSPSSEEPAAADSDRPTGEGRSDVGIAPASSAEPPSPHVGLSAAMIDLTREGEPGEHGSTADDDDEAAVDPQPEWSAAATEPSSGPERERPWPTLRDRGD